LQFSLGQKLRKIALHKIAAASRDNVVVLHPPFARACCLLFMTDVFGCEKSLAQTNHPLLITAVVGAKSYVAPLSEDIDLK
jgi:hypothetical protein